MILINLDLILKLFDLRDYLVIIINSTCVVQVVGAKQEEYFSSFEFGRL